MSKQLINIGTNPNDSTGDSLRDGGDKINDNFNELYDYEALTLGTGALKGGELSINSGDNTKIDIASGSGIISDYYTDPDNPTSTTITWSLISGVTLTNLATSPVTYILIDSDANVVQLNSFPTLAEFRQYIVLGVAVHSNNTNVEFINDLRTPITSPALQLHDLVRTMGRINIGNDILPNVATTTLSIQKTSGLIYGIGLNTSNSPNVTNVLNTPAIAPVTFRYRRIDETESSNIANIDPTQYESSSGVLSSVGNNKWTNQRVYLFPSNAVRIQYGQDLYNSKSEALQAIREETFIEEGNISENAILVAIITVRGGANNLNNSGDASIGSTGKLAEPQSTSSGVSVTKLQDAYNNSSQPQIILDAVRLGIEIRDASSPISDALFSLQSNNGNTNYFSVRPDKINMGNLPTFADDSAAGTGGLTSGDLYKTSTGSLRIKL